MTTTGTDGELHPLPPARILDTRDGTGGFSQPVGPNRTIDLSVAGRGGVPANGASAVVMNVTVTGPTEGSYLTVYPTGGARPVASNLNYVPGQTVPNLVVATLGPDGKVSIYNDTGSAHVIVDVAGWYDKAGVSGGSRYNSLSPARILDTRDGTGGFSQPVGPNRTIDMSVSGRGGVPANGASAVVMNVTVTGPTEGSYLTVYPTGGARPVASNLNYVPRQTVPNLVVAKVGPDGKVSIYNDRGSAHVIVDVAGWYGGTGSLSEARYRPIPPARVLDTRTPSRPVGPDQSIVVPVVGRNGVGATGVSAVVLNVTVTGPSAESYLTVYPAGSSRPGSSNLNYVPGQTVPNLVVAKVGPDGAVSIYNNAGSTHVVVDVLGYDESILDDEETSFLRLINDYRSQNGAQPLALSPPLIDAAKSHSLEMAQYNYFSHTSLDGSGPSQRAAAHGYPSGASENIAAGNLSAAATFEQWKSSPGHNTNMLNPSYRVIGIGRAFGPNATYRWYWTTTFGLQ